MLKTEKKTQQATPPAKKWRNKWRNNGQAWLTNSGYITPQGEYFSKFVWPSAEIAEQKAIEWQKANWRSKHTIYLGAFEVE